MKVWLVFMFTTFWCVQKNESAKILAVFPISAHSHFTLASKLVHELAIRGHEVTFLTPHPENEPPKNVREIKTTGANKFIQDVTKMLFSRETHTSLQNLYFINWMMTGMTESSLSDPELQKVLNSDETFDLVLMEYFLNDALLGFGHHFHCPIVVTASHGAGIFNNHVVDNLAPSSYVPNTASAFGNKLNFWQRLQNFGLNIAAGIMRELVFLPRHREMFRKFFGGTRNSDAELDEIMKNVSLMLSNSHPSIGGAVPRVPSVKDVGGYHVASPRPLPSELKEFLDSAKDGVVFFSMGSNLRSESLNEELRSAILGAFSKLKQKVLWKFESDLEGLPENVRVLQWVPQQGVLAHPNVKAFITHGGILSTIEAVYFGVPLIGIPIFGDQKCNIAVAEDNGYAISIPFRELTEGRLSKALRDILEDTSYMENVKLRSQVLADQPLQPIDSAMFWVEYVIRHKGAPLLKHAGLDLKWYQKNNSDVVAFVILTTVVLVALCIKLFNKFTTNLFRRRRPKQKNQ